MTAPPTRGASIARFGDASDNRPARSAAAYATRPKAAQTTRYPPTKTQVGTVGRPPRDLPAWIASNMRIIGAADGSIIAAIITTQVARKTGAVIPIVSPSAPLAMSPAG